MQSRNLLVRPTAWVCTEGNTTDDRKARSTWLTGVDERSMFAKGCPGTWEILSSPNRKQVKANTYELNARLTAAVAPRMRAKHATTVGSAWREGRRNVRDGRQEVGAPQT